MSSSNRIRAGKIMLLGFVTAALSGLLAFLMLPADAPIQETSLGTYIEPR